MITKRGAPVAKVVPMVSEEGGLFGFMSGEVRITGDIEAPVAPRKHRKALKT